MNYIFRPLQFRIFFDRRRQAHEALKQVDSAYKDAREVHRVDPKNNAIEPVLVRLHKAVSEKVYFRQIVLFSKSPKIFHEKKCPFLKVRFFPSNRNFCFDIT